MLSFDDKSVVFELNNINKGEKMKRPKFIALNVTLFIIASILVLYLSTKFVPTEREAKAQDVGKFFGKMKEKFNLPTLKRSKKSPAKKTTPQKTEVAENRKPKKPDSPLAEYQEIVDKNLFRPLGWEKKKKTNNPFRLQGTITDSGSKKITAIITRSGSTETYFVSEGDIIGNGYKVEEISENRVKLAHAEKGENFVMQFGWTTLGGQPSKGSSRKKPQAAPSGKNRSKKRGGGFKLPDDVKRNLPPGVTADMVKNILAKEGVTLQQVMSDRNLQRRLMNKYGSVLRGSSRRRR